MAKIENLYLNKASIKVEYALFAVVGAIILAFLIHLMISEVYLGFWSIAGPLLGLAMLLTGLTKAKIKEINHNKEEKSIEILKHSLFRSFVTRIPVDHLVVELKSMNAKKNNPFPKIRIVFLDHERQIEEIQSNSGSFNSQQIESLYSVLKGIVKEHINSEG